MHGKKLTNRIMNKLFTDNAFIFLANRERILLDKRLFYAPVEVSRELAYIGNFEPMTLGEYVEWWHECPWSVHFDDDDRISLVWYVSEGPGKYDNRCLAVDEKGEMNMFSVSTSQPLRSGLFNVIQRHKQDVRPQVVYSLQEAVVVLSGKILEQEIYTNRLKEFCQHVKKALLEDEDRYAKAVKQVSDYKKKWYKAVFHLKSNSAAELYSEYRSDATFIEELKNRKKPSSEDIKLLHTLRLQGVLRMSRRIPELFPEFVHHKFSTDIDLEGITEALTDYMENGYGLF